MNHTTVQPPSRREMLRGTVRYLALGAISLGSAGLIARGGRSSAHGGCPRAPSCSECPAATHCGLPRALSAERHRDPPQQQRQR